MRSRTLLLFSALLLTSNVASAQGIAGRATGLANPAYTLDFESFIVGNLPGVVNDVNFNGAWTVGGPGNSASSFTTNAIYNFPPCCTNPSTIWFTGPVNAVAFNFVTNPTTSTLSAYLGANLVHSFAVATNNTPTTNVLWYGFEGITFDRIEIDAARTNGAQGIDNVQVGVVPEPSTVVLTAAGLLALVAASRRRRTV